jgi:sec-independent protein translocase protein TatC
MIPSMLEFSANFGTDNIRNLIDINDYWGFLMLMILSAGVFFELPMVSFVLSRFGLLTPRFLKKYRRHAIVIILIIAAILTPSPDPFNQLIVASPIYILYEISIIISAVSIKKYYKNEEND